MKLTILQVLVVDILVDEKWFHEDDPTVQNVFFDVESGAAHPVRGVSDCVRAAEMVGSSYTAEAPAECPMRTRR